MTEKPPATFPEMLKTVRASQDLTQADMAKRIGISAQYLCDLELGRRLPSVILTDRICQWLGRGPAGVRAWHIAAARAHGFRV